MGDGALGLDPSRVVLRPYDPRWATLGDEERQWVREILGSLALDAQHVGSTSVAGLGAKPVLDIAVALDPSRSGTAEIVQLMEGAGYEFWGDNGPDGGIFFARREQEEVVAQVHLVVADEPAWEAYISFRELLRSDATVRSTYERLKAELVLTFGDDREAYTSAKASFITEALASRARSPIALASAADVGSPGSPDD